MEGRILEEQARVGKYMRPFVDQYMATILFQAQIAVCVAFSLNGNGHTDERTDIRTAIRTDGQTEGQTLISRCEDASKKICVKGSPERRSSGKRRNQCQCKKD